MNETRPNPAQRRVADQHLGDRLSALVDGELGHESRERVLAHLATCTKCKAEAADQRRLKNVFAEMAPPPPSESFLARLQGLPGGGDSDLGGGSPLGGGAFGGRIPGGSGVFGVRGEPFGYVPSEHHAEVLPPSQGRGFRIHDVSRHEAERFASRGLRFAFAAAGAVSLAAVALGGVSTGTTADTTDARGGSGSGTNVTPMRPQGAGASTAPDSQRRRSVGPLLGQGERTLGRGTTAPTEVSAPLLPGIPAPPDRTQEVIDALTAPVVAGAAVMSPLIRPFTDVDPVALTSWSTAPDITTPGLLVSPLPLPSSSPPPPHTSGTLR